MAEQRRGEGEPGALSGGADSASDPSRNNEENELEAEQESAEAMDSEVPQPPGASETTEGQPS